MNDLFIILFFLSSLITLIGLFKPAMIFRRERISRKKVGAFLGGATLLFLILGAIASPPATKQPQVALGNTTPTPSESPTPIPLLSHGGTLIKVVNVIDGDTIKVETGETVRYIGIDTPETVHPSKPQQCYGKEASDKNTELVEGKIVELEKDVSETDKYGRLLRYVWIDDTLINEVLVREGYANSSTYPPDVKYQNRFVEAQSLAQQEDRGLWGDDCSISTSVSPSIPAILPTSSISRKDSEIDGTYICDCSKTCSQMSSCAEAQYQLNVCSCTRRDADSDGIACDSECQ